jgi:hypothetical protein
MKAKASIIGIFIMALVFSGFALLFFFMAKGGTGITGPSGDYFFEPTVKDE